VVAHELHQLAPDFQVTSTAPVPRDELAQGARHAVAVADGLAQAEADGPEASLDGAALMLALRIEVRVPGANLPGEPHEAADPGP
jgi:hypothetical protein